MGSSVHPSVASCQDVPTCHLQRQASMTLPSHPNLEEIVFRKTLSQHSSFRLLLYLCPRFVPTAEYWVACLVLFGGNPWVDEFLEPRMRAAWYSYQHDLVDWKPRCLHILRALHVSHRNCRAKITYCSPCSLPSSHPVVVYLLFPCCIRVVLIVLDVLVFVLVAIVFFAWLQGPALVAEFHVHTRSMLPQDLFPSCRKVRLGLCRLERTWWTVFCGDAGFPAFFPFRCLSLPTIPKGTFFNLARLLARQFGAVCGSSGFRSADHEDCQFGRRIGFQAEREGCADVARTL